LFYGVTNRNVAIILLIFPGLLARHLDIYIGAPFFLTMVALVICRDISVPVRIRPLLNWLGDISYPLYLTHVSAMVLCNSVGWQGLVSQVSVAMGVAIVALHLVDYPIRLRKFIPQLKTAS
jgi:peptidoglycan/LPS O-acetylase OafA/YrhL